MKNRKYIRASCVCDSTLYFGVALMMDAWRRGGYDLELIVEDIENANPSWMATRFVVTGKLSNNHRRLHGLPMIRRVRR